MAVMHGMPGRYAKDVASKRFDRMLWATCLVTAVYCLATGYALGRFQAWQITLAVWVLVPLVLVATRLLRGPMDRLAKQRIRYLRGAQGEAIVGWILHDLPGGWHVFHGLQLREASDIDHVVVGPGGLFCVSTKATRGLLSAAPDGTYLLNNRPTDHLAQVRRQTMQLRDRLAALLGDVPWVQPVLAAPLAWVAFDRFQSAAWVLNQDDLLDTLSEQKARLTRGEVDRVVRALTMIAANAKEIYQRPGRPAARGAKPSPAQAEPDPAASAAPAARRIAG